MLDPDLIGADVDLDFADLETREEIEAHNEAIARSIATGYPVRP